MTKSDLFHQRETFFKGLITSPSRLEMKKNSENKTKEPKGDHNIGETINPEFPGRFTCGTGPDEEPACFQAAVRGLVNKGHSETEAKKAAEACFRALAKL